MAKTKEKVMLTMDMSLEEASEHVKQGRVPFEAYAEWVAAREKAADKHPAGAVYCKVSVKKAVSLYGLQRMPVTLYAEQWGKLLSCREQIEAFIADHKSELSYKEKK